MRDFLDRKLYRVRVEGDDIASVIGALSDDEIAALTERCRLAGVAG